MPHETPNNGYPVAPTVDGPTMESPDSNTIPGNSLVIGPPGYELLDVIGRGGMGIVYRGRDTALGRDVAVKLLQDRFPAESVTARRFVEEARITGQLQHPGIPAVHQVGTLPDGRPYLAMKLIKGRTLAEIIANPVRDVTSASLIHVFEQLAQAVGYAHAHQVIHRDLKPANIMVGAFGEVQVMDWGLAKVLGTGPSTTADGDESAANEIRTFRDTESTQAGTLLGTPAYMAPEQALGAIDRIDTRSDVFGLGAVLCVILTGKPPYLGTSGESILQMATRINLDDAFTRLDASDAEPELIALCKRCLSPLREDRPREAGEVARAVADWRAAADERARRAELDKVRAEGEAREQRKRRRVQLALAISIGLLVIVGGVFAWWQDRQTEQRKQESARIEGERKADQAKADAERAAETERARAGVTAAVALAVELRTKFRFKEATGALEQATKLISADSPVDMRAMLQQAKDDLSFVVELDRIRMQRSTWVRETAGKGRFDERTAPREYRLAFANHGLDAVDADSESVAQRIRESAVRQDLLAALDDWAVFELDPKIRDRVLAIARRVDPGDWQDFFRNPAVRESPSLVWLMSLSAETAVLPTGTIIALSALLERYRLDRSRILLAAQRVRPQEFLIAFDLTKWDAYAGRPELRLGQLQTARVTRPDNLAILNDLGNTLEVLGRWDEAIEYWREAVRIDPDFLYGHNNLGRVLDFKGDRKGAIAAFREAIRCDPTYSKPFTNLAKVLIETGADEEALNCLRTAIQLDPTDPRPHRNLGHFWQDKGQIDRAITHFHDAIKAAPKDPIAYRHLGEALEIKKDLPGALKAFENGVLADPTDAEAHNRLGGAWFVRNEYRKAIACFQEAIRLKINQAAVYFNLGSALARINNLPSSIVAFREGLRLNPKDAPALYKLGIALRETGDPDGAIDSFRQAVKFKPSYVAAYCELGRTLRQKGDLRAAADTYREALRHDPLDSDTQYGLGLVLIDANQSEEAIPHFQATIDLVPTHALAYHHLGLALEKQNDLRGAMACYRRAIELNPNYSPSHNNLGLVLGKLKNWPAAIASCREAVRLAPTNHVNRINLGATLGSYGDLDGSIREIQEAIRLAPTNTEYPKFLEITLRRKAERDAKKDFKPKEKKP